MSVALRTQFREWSHIIRANRRFTRAFPVTRGSSNRDSNHEGFHALEAAIRASKSRPSQGSLVPVRWDKCPIRDTCVVLDRVHFQGMPEMERILMWEHTSTEDQFGCSRCSWTFPNLRGVAECDHDIAAGNGASGLAAIAAPFAPR